MRISNPAEFGRPVFLGWRLNGSAPTRRSLHDGAFSGPAGFESDGLGDTGFGGSVGANAGPSWLYHPAVAAMTAETIQTNADTLGQYTLHAWALMPNHLDLLITPVFPLSSLTALLRAAIARKADALLGLGGQPFWHESTVQYAIANDLEFGQTWLDIESQPVRAGLARRPCDYPWSSAAAAAVPLYSEPIRAGRGGSVWL